MFEKLRVHNPELLYFIKLLSKLVLITLKSSKPYFIKTIATTWLFLFNIIYASDDFCKYFLLFFSSSQNVIYKFITIVFTDF